MNTSSRRLVMVVLVLAGGFLLARMLATSGSNETQRSSDALAAVSRKAELDDLVARARARLERGPYVTRTSHISPTEQLQIVLIPEGHTDELDTRCIVYTNSELRTSAMTCTGVLFRQPVPPS